MRVRVPEKRTCTCCLVEGLQLRLALFGQARLCCSRKLRSSLRRRAPPTMLPLGLVADDGLSKLAALVRASIGLALTLKTLSLARAARVTTKH